MQDGTFFFFGLTILKYFGLTNIRDIFDDHDVIWLLSRLIQNVIGLNHVVNDVTFGNL